MRSHISKEVADVHREENRHSNHLKDNTCNGHNKKQRARHQRNLSLDFRYVVFFLSFIEF